MAEPTPTPAELYFKESVAAVNSRLFIVFYEQCLGDTLSTLCIGHIHLPSKDLDCSEL